MKIQRYLAVGGLSALFCLIQPLRLSAVSFTAPNGYSSSTLFSTNVGIAGFDVASDQSLVLILNSGAGFGQPANQLVRYFPTIGTLSNLYTFESGVFGDFVKIQGSAVYFGQSSSFSDPTSITNRIMSIGLNGSGFATNLLLQNYTANSHPGGDLYFSGKPNSNGIFRLNGSLTNRVVNMPEYSAGFAFATNGDLYAGQTTASFQNNLVRFSNTQVTNALATGIALNPSDGVQVGTNISGNTSITSDSDKDIFIADYTSTLLRYDTVSNSFSAFGSGGVSDGFSILQFAAGANAFEANTPNGGTLYGYISDGGSGNAIIGITSVPEPSALILFGVTGIGLAFWKSRRRS